jgi:hypothetical protein
MRTLFVGKTGKLYCIPFAEIMLNARFIQGLPTSLSTKSHAVDAFAGPLRNGEDLLEAQGTANAKIGVGHG